jgi:hypothetical protein
MANMRLISLERADRDNMFAAALMAAPVFCSAAKRLQGPAPHRFKPTTESDINLRASPVSAVCIQRQTVGSK